MQAARRPGTNCSLDHAVSMERRLAATFACVHTPPVTRPITPYLLTDACYVGRQDDASEFLHRILDPVRSPTLALRLRGHMTQTLRCTACDLTRPSQDERFQHITASLLTRFAAPIKSVQDAVDAYMPPEVIDDDLETPCSRCEGRRFSKEHAVTVAPEILMVCLNRWADPARPLLHYVEATETLEFANTTHKLRAVVSHLGRSPHHGHYVAVTRHDTSNGAWWLYNDALRRKATPEEVATRASLDGHGQMQSYVLLYER